MIQIFFGGGKEFYLATSDSKRFEPAWSQHTFREGGVKNFFRAVLKDFHQKSQTFQPKIVTFCNVSLVFGSK